MEVWIMLIDWATDNASDVSITIYENESLAKDAFEKTVQEEISEYWSSCFTGGIIDNSYSFEKDDTFFEIYEYGNYMLNHTRIFLEKKLVRTTI